MTTIYRVHAEDRAASRCTPHLPVLQTCEEQTHGGAPRGGTRADRHSCEGKRRPDAGRLPVRSAEGYVTPWDHGWVACTLQLQGLAGRELTELAVGQGEFVPLELQRHRGLGLGHSTWRPRKGSQLGYFDYLPTCGNAEEKEILTLEESV